MSSDKDQIRVELYLKPKIHQNTGPVQSGDCIAVGKKWITSTDDPIYSPMGEHVKKYFESLEKENKINLMMYDLNKYAVIVRNLFKGVGGEGAIFYVDGKHRKTVKLKDALAEFYLIRDVITE